MTATANWDPKATQQAIIDHALASGHFEVVNGHEPANAPGNGLACAIWADRIVPIRASGLDSVSLRISFSIRVYTLMTSFPQDDIDPTVLGAVANLMAAYAGAFELGGRARQIDLFGAHGLPLQAQAGYLNQDDRQYRVVTVSLPIIFNDVFDEVA